MNDEQWSKEYQQLRKEMLHYIDLQSKLTIFAITTVAAILAFSLQSGNLYISLLAFLVILPLASRCLDYTRSVVRMAAYAVVFSEPDGVNWETRLAQSPISSSVVYRDFFSRIQEWIRHSEFFFLSLTTTIVISVSVISEFQTLPTFCKLSVCDLPVMSILYLLTAVVLTTFIYWLTKKRLGSDVDKDRFIEEWQEVKALEVEKNSSNTDLMEADDLT